MNALLWSALAVLAAGVVGLTMLTGMNLGARVRYWRTGPQVVFFLTYVAAVGGEVLLLCYLILRAVGGA